jgi:hypothetical protein
MLDPTGTQTPASLWSSPWPVSILSALPQLQEFLGKINFLLCIYYVWSIFSNIEHISRPTFLLLLCVFVFFVLNPIFICKL